MREAHNIEVHNLTLEAEESRREAEAAAKAAHRREAHNLEVHNMTREAEATARGGEAVALDASLAASAVLETEVALSPYRSFYR